MKTVRVRALRSDSIRDEAAWIPASLGDVTRLRSRLTAAGHPPAVVSGVTGWLVAKAAGEEDHTSADTRARYRRILRELADTDDGLTVRSLAA